MTSLPTTVDCFSNVTVTATADLTHLCPHVDEVDKGSVTITWAVCGRTIELHSLRAYLDGFKDMVLSHEDVSDLIRRDLSSLDELDLLAVTSTWDTAGMAITVIS